MDTTRTPRFLSYEQTERMIGALLGEAARWRPEAVVGIARGGTIPATMAATTLALPLAAMSYDRASAHAAWLGAPAEARRVLLVDDGCSTGRTMEGVRAALLAEGRACLTLAVVHDPDCAAFVPDLSHPMRELWRFPWERGEATPRARAWRVGGREPERSADVEAPFVAVDLDVCLRRSAQADPLAGLPLFAAERALLLATAPEAGQASTATWLARFGYPSLAVYLLPAETVDRAALARHKAEAATRFGCTHLIEADAEQAIRIAAFAPHLIVTWWSAEDRGYVVGAGTTLND